jgi:hypothetical protein
LVRPFIAEPSIDCFRHTNVSFSAPIFRLQPGPCKTSPRVKCPSFPAKIW